MNRSKLSSAVLALAMTFNTGCDKSKPEIKAEQTFGGLTKGQIASLCDDQSYSSVYRSDLSEARRDAITARCVAIN